MFSVRLVFTLAVTAYCVFGKAIETPNMPANISANITEASNQSATKGLSMFKPSEGSIFKLVHMFLNKTYVTSKAAVDKIKEHSQIRRKIEDNLEGFVENLPSIPIPLLDNLADMRKNMSLFGFSFN